MLVRKNALEWTVFVGSALLVVALVGLLAAQAWQPDTPPHLVATAEAGAAQADGRAPVAVTVRNEGAETAAAVEVEVRGAGAPVTLVFDYVPRHAERRGTVLVPLADSGARVTGRITARVVGYTEP